MSDRDNEHNQDAALSRRARQPRRAMAVTAIRQIDVVIRDAEPVNKNETPGSVTSTAA